MFVLQDPFFWAFVGMFGLLAGLPWSAEQN